jgi:YVTN family beta-propeller protein
MNTKFKPISLAVIFLLAFSFLALIPIAVNPVHAQVDTAPTISPSFGEFLPGQTIALTVTGETAAAGDLYLYNEASASCLNPTLGTLVGGPTAEAGGVTYSTGFSVATTAATTGWFCAVFVDGTSTLSYTSGVTSYTITTPVTSYVNNDESKVTIDLGQSIVLTVYPTGGAPPYTYAWYAGTTCTGPVLGTLASYTATPGATGEYSVLVTDSSFGTPANADCEHVTVTVNPTLGGTFTIDGLTGVISDQVGSPAFEAIVTFSGGTGPWYAVTIYSGSDSLVCGTTKVASANDITGTEAILSFPEPSTPSSTIYYCAVLSDSSMGTSPTYPLLLGPIQVNTAPALSAPTLTIAPSAIDYGFTTTVDATVTWAGGTSPYYVVLTSGSSPSCAAPDNNFVTFAVVSGGALYVYPGVSALANEYVLLGYTVATSTGVTMTLSFTSPTSTTYYCAIVFDSSAPTPSQTYTAAGAKFTVESLFATNAPTLSSYATEVQTPLYEGTPDTATVTWSGGTGPFDVTLYPSSPTTCEPVTPVTVTPGSNPQTGVTGDSASFTFLVPNTAGTYFYCAVVVDSTGNFVISGPSLGLVVAPYLGTVTAVFGPGVTSIDTGQTEAVSVIATWAGGSSPYTATLYSGASAATCTTKVASQSGIVGLTATFKFTSASTTTYYCVGVTDSSVPVSSGLSTTILFTTSPPPVVTLPLPYEIPAGTGTTITPTIAAAGIAPDYVQWFIGPTCTAANAITGVIGPIPPATGAYHTGVITATTTYSVLLTDSSAGTPPMSSCASTTISVDDGPMGVAAVDSGHYAGLAYVANPSTYSLSVIDSDSNSVIFNIPLVNTPGTDPLIPFGVAVDPVANFVWVTGTDSITGTGYLCLVYILTNTEDSCYAVGTAPEGVAVNTALTTTQVYVANSGSNTVSVFTYGIGVTATVPVGPGPMGVAVDQSTGNVYVTDNGGNTLSVLQPVLNPPYGFVVTTVTVGFEPVGVAVDPLTNNVYVANSGSGTVSVLSGFTYNTLATIKVGGSPMGIDIDSATNAAYVANAATGSVSVINLATNAITTTTSVGSGPFGVAVDLPNGSVFVTNAGSNTVSVIDAATNTVVATIIVP